MQNTPWKNYVKLEDIQNDDLKTIAEEAGLELSIRIIMALRGLTIYVPLKPFKKSVERYILAKYDGTKYSINKLASDCNMTQRQVSKIIKNGISSLSCCS